MDSKRKHLRFTCDGSADLTDGKKGRIWGQLGDISLGGFYVSTYTPWAVDTEVRFKVEVDGKEINGVGVVSTSHPGVGMAVNFQELSKDHQATLDQVVEKLSSTSPGESETGVGV